MWNRSKSLLLTAWWVRLSLVIWLVLAVAVPFVMTEQAKLVFFYLVYVPVAVGLYGLHRLLANLRKGYIFDGSNITWLRLVSWACFFGAVFLLIGGCLWPVLLPVSGAVGFLGLFVRVIKNMLAEAIVLKEENDYTI